MFILNKNNLKNYFLLFILQQLRDLSIIIFKQKMVIKVKKDQRLLILLTFYI